MGLRYLSVVAMLLVAGCGKCTSDGSGAPAPSASASAATSAADGVDAGIRRVKVVGGVRGPIKTIPTTVLPADSAHLPRALPSK